MVNELKTSFVVVLITIAKNTRNKLTTDQNWFQARFSSKCHISHIQFLTFIGKPCFTHFRQFSKRLSDFKYSYLSQRQQKVKPNGSKSQLAQWQSKNVLFLKILPLLCILCLIKQEHLFGVTWYNHYYYIQRKCCLSYLLI